MSIDAIQAVITPATLPPDSWGTDDHFAGLSGVGTAVAEYWCSTVHRPAHRIAHPKPMHGCPGCAFEAAAKRAAVS